MAQTDRAGNVNVSRFGPKLAGAGGFINISQNARKLVFAGHLHCGRLEVRVEEGKLRIVTEGSSRSSSTRSSRSRSTARRAASGPASVLRHRALRVPPHAEGLELAEVAPGIDVERDIFAHMRFRPIVREPKTMDARIFGSTRWGWRTRCC